MSTQYFFYTHTSNQVWEPRSPCISPPTQHSFLLGAKYRKLRPLTEDFVSLDWHPVTCYRMRLEIVGSPVCQVSRCFAGWQLHQSDYSWVLNENTQQNSDVWFSQQCLQYEPVETILHKCTVVKKYAMLKPRPYNKQPITKHALCISLKWYSLFCLV